MRIGSMIRQLLEEVKAAPLDEASRARLKEIHQASIKELEAGPGTRAGRGAGAAVAAVHRGLASRPRASCGSRRPSWSAGSRACSTASRPRSTPSRWPPARSSSRSGGPCRPARPCPAGRQAASGDAEQQPPRHARRVRRDVPLARAARLSAAQRSHAQPARPGAGRAARRSPAPHPGRRAGSGSPGSASATLVNSACLRLRPAAARSRSCPSPSTPLDPRTSLLVRDGRCRCTGRS